MEMDMEMDMDMGMGMGMEMEADRAPLSSTDSVCSACVRKLSEQPKNK